jgi:hypothetical protein
VKEDAEYYYFQANTPGFSLFAITGDVDAEILKQPEEKREETIATIQAQGTTQPTIEKPQPATNQLPFYLIIGIVGVVVGLIIFIVFVRTRKTTGKESASQSKEKQEPEKPRNACAICSQPITFKYQCSMCKRNMCINHVSLVGGRLVCHQCQK